LGEHFDAFGPRISTTSFELSKHYLHHDQ